MRLGTGMLVLFAGVAFDGAAAAAAPLACGSTLTEDTVLTADLSCSRGVGLTLAAGVELDLGGHSVTGHGDDLGLVLSAPGGQTVTNGTLARWRMGISADFEGNSDPVQQISVSLVSFVDAWSSLVHGATAAVTTSTGVRSGFYARSMLTISSSSFRDSSIVAGGPDANLEVLGSWLVSTPVAGEYGGHLTVAESTLDGRRNGEAASCTGFGSTVDLNDSTVIRFRDPIHGYGCGIGLRRNTFRDNRGGVLGSTGDAVNPGGAYVENNIFRDSGIVLDSDSMRVRNNRFYGNVTGIIAQDPANTIVTGNLFSRQSSSGIRTAGPGLTLGANKAVGNGRYGINAPGAVDLGKNVASGNGLTDCIGVTCRTG